MLSQRETKPIHSVKIVRTLLTLTPTEHIVVILLLTGHVHPRQIAEALHMTKKTAANHIDNIREKFGVHSIAEILAILHSLTFLEILGEFPQDFWDNFQ